MWAE
ncbi:hypothetical protein EC01288_2308, partial [Escherichia coli 0.1288]